MQQYEHSDMLRKATKAEVLAAILFQTLQREHTINNTRRQAIIELFQQSSFQYLLKNYVKVYYYEHATEEGKRFYELLRQHELL